MKIRLKQVLLHLCKWLGIFHLTSFLYRRRLQILCYHGYSYEDEHAFAPGLFMRPQVFRQRMQWLARNNFNVVGLDEGVARLRDGSLPPHSVILTADDGFRSIGELAVPIVEALRMPFTVYVTTYYMDKATPIFRLAMQYMAWKAGDTNGKVLTTLANRRLPAGWQARLADKSPVWQLIGFAESELPESERVELCKEAAALLGADYDAMQRDGLLTLMTEAEIRALAERGIDIQLHTHRHSLPEDPQLVSREITENRARLEPLAAETLTHFCYPSGIWTRAHWPALRALGIKSATTCEPGMNTAKTPLLALNRFLDRDDITQIEFEAEMCGFKELLRAVRHVLSGQGLPSSAKVVENPG